jgi:hypothetical protein
VTYFESYYGRPSGYIGIREINIYFHSFSGWYFIVKGKVVPVLNYLSSTPWRRMGEWVYRSKFFFYFYTSWRWVVSFTPQPLYPRGRSPRYPLDKLGGPQSRSGRRGDEDILDPIGHLKPIKKPDLKQIGLPRLWN